MRPNFASKKSVNYFWGKMKYAENCKMYEKFGWICEYRDKLHSWKSLVDIVKTATAHVNVTGIYEGLDADLREQFNELQKDAEFYHIEDELIEFCIQQQ